MAVNIKVFSFISNLCLMSFFFFFFVKCNTFLSVLSSFLPLDYVVDRCFDVRGNGYGKKS